MTFEKTYPDGVVAKINATIPGYRDALEAADHLKQLPLPFADVAGVASYNLNTTPSELLDASVAVQLANELTDQAAAGVLVTGEDLVERAGALYLEAKAAELARTAIGKSRTGLAERPQQIRRAHHGTILAALNAALATLLDEVRSLRPLDEIDTAQAAVDSDRALAHRLLQVLGRHYAEIRSEQYRVMKVELDGEPWPMSEALVFPDVRSFFALWAPWHDPGHLVHRSGKRLRDVIPPWPAPGDAGLSRGHTESSYGSLGASNSRQTLLADSDRVEFLVWCVDHDVDLWVPTLDQLEETSQELHAVLQSPDRSALGPESEWLDPVLQLQGASR